MPDASDQLEQLNALLAQLAGQDTFYAPKLRATAEQPDHAGTDNACIKFDSLEAFTENFPFTTRDDLLRDQQQHPPFGSNLTAPLGHYTRCSQTSGTSTGEPMTVIDTPQSWQTMLATWREVYRHAGLSAGRERIFFAFGFGPFLGFWTAFEAAANDYLCLPGGGLDSRQRLGQMARLGATVLCCTPTYAIRLGQMIGQAGYPAATELAVQTILVAGEPGGSIPAIRKAITRLWNGARVFDHHGMTETGPISWQHPRRPGILCLDHQRYLCEVIDPVSGTEVEDGSEGELVITTLARTASPLLRYRTGDRVRKVLLDGVTHLDGGILGRADEMRIIRGVNLYPCAVEEVVRTFFSVDEFLVIEREVHAMPELEIRIETSQAGIASQLARSLRDRFSLRIAVTEVAPGSLPRHEFKSQRWIREQ
jgi:phenylacetate-CoA ligase